MKSSIPRGKKCICSSIRNLQSEIINWKGITIAPLPYQLGHSRISEKANVFVLHCGLDLKKLQKCCDKLDLAVNLIPFRREEIFSYYVRLDRPRPDLIVIRSHFHSLITSLNHQKCIPTIVVSTHQKPSDCHAPFIRAHEGYEGPHASNAYKTLALTMRQELLSVSDLPS